MRASGREWSATLVKFVVKEKRTTLADGSPVVRQGKQAIGQSQWRLITVV